MTKRELEGREVAAAITRGAARRAACFTAAMGRPVGVVAVGWSTDTTTDRFLASKERAFRDAGFSFRGVVLDPGEGTAAAAARVAEAGRDEAVDGVFVQFPVPAGLDARRLLGAVPLARDIDGARRGFPNATAAAVIRVLTAHGVPLPGARAVVVSGQPVIAEWAAELLSEEGASVVVPPPELAASGRLSGGDVVVVASGRPGSVPESWLPEEAVVVDTGYYHGGGRGDVAWGDPPRRLRGRVPPVGGVGPVTVAVLMEHAVAAAEARSGLSRRRP